MISTFNITKLKLLLQDFHNITNIQATLFDENFEVITAYPEISSMFCHTVRSDPLALKACLLCDKSAIQMVHNQKKSYVYKCHAGLTESITPILMGNITIGYLYLSATAVYDSYEEGWANIHACCKNYNIDFSKLKEAFFDMTLIKNKNLISAAHIMDAVASYLCLERMAYIKKEDISIRIDKFINQNICNCLDIDTICQKFNIGKTNLYYLSMQNYGVGIAKHIRNLRIQKAKNLLIQDMDMNISDISAACGFEDYNYFITLFKRENGISPKKYRTLFYNEQNVINVSPKETSEDKLL